MARSLDASFGRVRAVHPYAWLWEPLAGDPTFVLRSFFGGKAVYLDGKLMLHFTAHAEPWRGMLVCTGHEHHEALLAEFPELSRHPILPKWLYLSEGSDSFEGSAEKIVAHVGRRDPRIGVTPKPRKKRKSKLGRPR